MDPTRVDPPAPGAPGSPEAGTLRRGLNVLRFRSEGDPLVANLFLPDSWSSAQRLPVVVVTGSWTTVKEQMPNLYARRLADAGLAALTFDFRGFGESGGAPRQWESASRKIEDLRAAADFAGSLPVTSPDRVGGLGICASAGHMAHAIARGAPFHAFATVAAWLHDPGTVGQFYGGAEGVAARIARSRAARERFERRGEVVTVPAYDPSNPEAAMFFPLDYYERLERGAVPQWKNQFAVMGWEEWLTFDALAPAPRIAIPSLVVHSDGAALPDNVRRFHAALAGPKRLDWTEGTQTDFYDRDPQVDRAVRAVVAHFRATLGE